MAISGKVFSGWRVASVYDPATGTTVQLNKLSLENTEFTEEVITTDTTDTQIYGGKEFRLTLGFFDDAGVSQLTTWMENYTPVRVVAAGGANLQWYESEPIKIRKLNKTDKRTGLDIYVLEIEHRSDVPQIYNNENLVAYLGWTDANANGIADGYTATNMDTGTFMANVQSVNNNAGGARFGTNVEFPISGIDLTFSENIVALGTEASTIAVLYFAFGDSFISVDSTALSGTGVKSLTSTAPSTTNYFNFRLVDINGFVAPETFSFSFPSITTNGRLSNGTLFTSW